MPSTPFDESIESYEPQRGFVVPKFTMYDDTVDPFDHLMHYQQVMTLDAGTDPLMCKVFPVSFH